MDLQKPSDKKPSESDPTKRVVQTEAGDKVEVAPKKAFLGWQNQVVERQTVSKNHSVSQKSAARSKPRPQVSPQKTLLSNLGVPLLSRARPVKDDSPEWATPGARAEDYVKGLKESDVTALNTTEYLYYGYFQRIRERLDRAWVPILKKKLFTYYHSGRHLASDMDHMTKVVVTLSATGEIKRVRMISESGTRDLDEAAVAAFNQAGPFPNPPKGMIDRNGEVSVPWDFVLKT